MRWGMSLLAVVGTAVTQTAWGQSPEEFSAMRERMEQMERELATMRQQVDEQASQIRAQEELLRQSAVGPGKEEVDRVVREVLADAETRATLFPASGPVNAGYDKGFFISSGEDFMLRLRGLLMTRYAYSHQQNSTNDDDRGGFELARTRFGFFGHVIDPSWQFVLWNGYTGTGSVLLLDAYIKKAFENGWSLTAGQYKVPLWREWLVSETRLPVAERSLLNVFAGSYTQGLMLGYEKDRFHAYLSASDGLGAINTGAMAESVEGLGVTGRLEWLALGKWAQYADVEAWPGDEPLLVLGAAGHFQQGEYGTTREEPRIYRWTVDSTLKKERLSLQGALVGNHQTNDSPVDQFGTLVQVGYFLTKSVEGHVRYEWGDPDLPEQDDLSIITLGIDHHWVRHQVRVIFDIGYSFNGVGSFYANPTGSGWRADAAGEDGQIVVRGQFELNF